MNDTTLNNYTMSEQKPVINEIKQPREWTRTTFDFYDGRAWCFRKVEHWEDRRTFNKGFYCYNCKSDLFFKPWDTYDRDLEPFRFHKLLVKKLEKKDDDWRTGRKTHSYYAFCCACSRKDTSDGKITKKWGKVLGFTMEKCDCDEYVKKELAETQQEISNYFSMISDCQILINELGHVRAKYASGEMVETRNGKIDKDFKTRRIDDFIQQLEKRKESDQSSLNNRNKYLDHVRGLERKFYELTKGNNN